MNQNGFSEINTHDGTVFVEGDMNIDGNLYVSGTYPGGGGGGSVNNPMTEDLQAGGYAIYNISEITGQDGVLALSSTINLQDNNIEGVNTIKVDKITTQNPENYFIDCDGKIFNNANAFTLNNGLSFSSILVPEVNHVLTVEPGATNIGYKKAVFNPVEESVDMKSNNIDHCDTLDVHFIKDTVENKVKFLSVVHTLQPLYCFQDIVLNYKRIYYCNSLIAAHNESGLGLDMIPATVGLPGQVLARDPAFNPADPLTYKLVWTNQSSGGGVTNPMTANLFANDFNIYQANILEGKNILIMAGGGGIACNAGGSSVPVTWLLAIKKSTSPFYQTFNTDYITPQTIAGVTIDSKWEDGITDTKISLQTPILNINNSTNLTPTDIQIFGNIQITQGSGHIHGNNLIIRGRTASNVPTSLTLEGSTTAINSTTLNINSNANVISGNTNFTQTLRTNFIDAHSGSNIAILQNLTLAETKKIQTPFIFSDALRSYTNTELFIAGLLPDNKTQTNIIISSPQISFNNQFGITQTQVNISGGLVFNNPVTIPFIHGANLIIRGRTTAGADTGLMIEGTTVVINSSTLQLNSTFNNNITGQTNFDKNINLLSNRGFNINPSMVLYRSYGTPSTAFNITDNLTYVKVTDGQTAKGSKIIPVNGLVLNDIYKLTLKGLLSTSAVGNMEFAIFVGANRACSFSFINTSMSNEGFEFSCELSVRDVGLGVLAVDIGIGKLERNSFPTRISPATSGVNMSNVASSVDIFMKPTANLGTGSVTIYNYTLENI